LTKFYFGNFEKRGKLGDLGEDGRIVLKCSEKTWISYSGGLCQQSSEISGSIKSGELIP
jgi:hypothetical protein